VRNPFSSWNKHLLRLLYTRLTMFSRPIGFTLGLLCLLPGLAFANAAFSVDGVQGKLRDNIEGYLSTLQLSCSAPQWQVDAALTQAREKTRLALEALGYYRSRLTFSFKRQNHCWHIDIKINPGPPVRITRSDVAIVGPGDNNPGFKKIIDSSGLKVGEVLNQGLYSSLKQRLKSYAREMGYFDARFTRHTILIDPYTRSARITLIMQSGPRYVFGPTVLHQSVLAPWLVRGYLLYHQGEPYSANLVVQSQNALVASGYFDLVQLQSEVDKRHDDQVPMSLTLTAARPYRLILGAGYNTNIGPNFNGKLIDYRLNRTGHSYTLSTQLSPVQSQLGFEYKIPLRRPLTNWLNLASNYQYQHTTTAITRTLTLGGVRTHLLENGWLRKISLQYLNEYSYSAGQSLTSELLIPGIGFSRTRSNRLLYPTRGWSVDATLLGAVDGFVSTVSFAQINLSLKGMHPLLGGRLFGRLHLGATAVNVITQLPSTLRFYTGGDKSIRGYAYQSLGPTDASGSVIGGRYLAVGSLEYDHRLVGAYYWGVFYDLGNAFNKIPFTVYRSAGIGFGWHSPVGPIRIDLAHPFERPGPYFRLSISIGSRL